MAELLLELLSEEIPARMQARAAEDLERLVLEGLQANGLAATGAGVFVTPRRLTLRVDGLPASTPDVSEERRGPRVGAPQQALDGFLKGAGVALEHCEQRDTGKGVFYIAVIAAPGAAKTNLVIKDVIEQVMGNFPWPKSMRWGALAVRWVRPLQSILCLFDGKVVPVVFGPQKGGGSHRRASIPRTPVLRGVAILPIMRPNLAPPRWSWTPPCGATAFCARRNRQQPAWD